MSDGGRTLARNLLAGVAGEAVSGTLNFLTFILVARALGTEQFGVFSYVLAFVGVFQLLADFGVTNILVREITRARDRVEEIVGLLRPLAWISSLAAFAIIAVLGAWLSPDNEVYVATLLLGLSVLATFHSFSYASVCRAFEEMGYNAIGNVAHKIVQLGLVLAALRADLGVVGVGAAMLVANLAQWLFFLLVVRLRYVRSLRWRYDRAYWRYLLREATPIGVAMVLRRANQHVGTLVLTLLTSPGPVGLFSAALKIVQMIDMIPFTLSIPLFPPFARLARESQERLFAMLTRSLRLFMIVAAPVLVWVLALAPRLVDLMFGAAYADAVPTLRALAFCIPFLFVTALYAYLFSALERQRYYSLSSGCCVLANLLLNLALIPAYGHFGAAVAAVAGEAMFCVAGIWCLHRVGYRLPLLSVFAAPLLLAALCGLALLPAATAGLGTVLLLSVLFGLLYLALVVLSGTLRRDERRQLLALLRRPRAAGAAA